MILRFAKYEGAGNDFIIVDARTFEFEPSPEGVAMLCDRHFGIGADGLMSLELSGNVDFKMRYYNSDGREASMCGNGGRCISLFAHHLGISDRTKRFVGADGIHEAKILKSDDASGTVELQMCDVTHVEKYYDHFQIDTGSPHYVVFVDDVAQTDVVNMGRTLRDSIDGGTNVNFVQIIGPDTIKIRTYERGVENETLACGTGATASAIATYVYTGAAQTKYNVQAVGGKLTIEFTSEADGSFSHIKLTGGARKVFSGKTEIYNFKLKSR